MTEDGPPIRCCSGSAGIPHCAKPRGSVSGCLQRTGNHSGHYFIREVTRRTLEKHEEIISRFVAKVARVVADIFPGYDWAVAPGITCPDEYRPLLFPHGKFVLFQGCLELQEFLVIRR